MRLSSGKSSKNDDSGDKKVESSRRSERLGKQTPPNVSPVTRKSMRLEPQPQSTPSPVRRSGRFQTQGSSAEKASSLTDFQKKKGLRDKSVQQLIVESAEVSLGNTDNSMKRKGLNARSYKALFKKQKKLKGGESKFEHNQVDSCDNTVSITTQPLEHRENGNLQCGLNGIETLLEASLASSSKESNEKESRIDVEPEFAYHDQSFSDKPPGFSVRADVDGSLIGCTNTETVDDVSESTKDHSLQKGDMYLESGQQVAQLEVDSSKIVANKESSTLVVEAVASISAASEHENDKTNGYGVDCLNSNLVNMKEISVACGLKSDSSKFVEYWVPVPVSNVQLEYYCATLLANEITLCSPLKKDYVGVLPNILVTVQKCCDHPNLVDRSLHLSIMKDFTPRDSLNVDIKASGKLQLLDMILSKCRRPKLKVLILYQSFAGSGGIGDVLDDYMRQKFGENSYGRLESSLIPSKRQETLIKFNDKGGEQFVLLLEHRACSSSVKLLLVDFVIIFNTELSLPANELKDLQRMSIAQHKQIKVFRLYSCHTLEERLLILAKHHKSVNILQSTNRTMSDSLLMWGASVLFNRLDKFHAEQSTSLSLDCLCGQQSLLDDIVKTFMDKIFNECEDNCEHDSIVSRAFFNEGVYHMDKLLLGEKDVQQIDGVERQLFWKKLLEGQKPWKFWGPTSRSRKRGTYDENSETATKHQKVVDTRDTGSNFHPEVESRGQDANPIADSDPSTSENEQTSLHEFLKNEMEKLCLVLQLSVDIKQMVGAFMEYVIKNHQVNKEPVSILHAFQISLCWAAAKIMKKNMNKRETLTMAKNALDFQCTDEEAYSVYERLRALKKTFQQLQRTNSVSLPSPNVSAPQGIRKQTLYEGHPLAAALDVQILKVEDKEASCRLELSEELTVDELNGSCPNKKMKKLQKQHEKEILDFHKRKEQEKSRLERDIQIESAFIRKTYPENGTARSMLMQLDNELKKKIQEYENLIEVQFQELQTKHSVEKKKMVDEWRTKVMSRIARSNAEREVPRASHNTEKQNPNTVVQDNGTRNLISSGVSVTIADNALDSAARSKASLGAPVNHDPDELLRIEIAGAEPSTVIEQPGKTSQRSPQRAGVSVTIADNAVDSAASSKTTSRTPVNHDPDELLRIERACAEPATVIEQPEKTRQRSLQSQTIVALEAGGSGASDNSSCVPVNSVRVELLEIEPGGTVMERPEETNQISHQIPTDCAGGSESSLCTPEDEVSGVELVGSESVTVAHLEVASQVSPQTPPDKALEIEHARVEPVKGVERSKESSSQNNGPSAGTGGSKVGDACTSEMKNSLEVETGDGRGNPVGGDHNNEPSSVRGPSGSESGNARFSDAETGDNLMGSEATGEHNIPSPQPSTEDRISMPIIPSSELLQNNVHEKTGTLASDCSKLSVDAVNHVHTERNNSLPAPTASVQMVEGSMELPHEVVSQNEGTMVMASVEENAGNLCGNQVDGSIASPASATSQVVQESVEHSYEETIVQPPSREIVDPTHCDNHFDLETVSGANDGPSVELPAASQNVLAPILQAERPNLAVAEGPTQLHVNPMQHIGSRISTFASHAQSLQSELDYLRKDREHIVKLFDGKKSFLKSECERELEEIRMKYEEKLKEAESVFKQEMTQVDSNHRVASMHKTLSEALQYKCSDGRTPGNSTMNQGLAAGVSPRFIQQMHQVQARMRHPSAATLSSTSHPTTVQQNAFSPVQNHRPSTFSSTGRPAMSLPSITSSHHRSSGPFASARPPQISSITPSVGSSRVGGEFRSPAPHLQPYRPPSSSAPRLPANILMPTQLMTAPSLSSPPPVPSHQPSQISLRPNPPSQSPSMLHPSSLNQGVGGGQLFELPNGVPRSRLDLSFSAMEMLMANVANVASTANASSDPSANRVLGNVNGAIPTSDSASDVVFLSDDES